MSENSPCEALNIQLGSKVTTVRFVSLKECTRNLSPSTGKSMVVFDSNTARLLSPIQGSKTILPPGEEEKNIDSAIRLLTAALEANIGRDGVFFGVGGGVVCDLTAFVASIYARGCRVTLVPTTLLSMVDASIGGKTGVDFGGYKNLVGTFHPADEVLIVPELLKTLPDREYLSGIAEVIKHALLMPSEWLARLEGESQKILSRDSEILPALIHASLSVKARIVQEDFYETGIRSYLNLGHTFGHALESVSGFSTLSHGEAVAWGISCALRVGVDMGVTNPRYADRVTELLRLYGFRQSQGLCSPDSIIAAMKFDKKKSGEKIRFVLQRDWGETFLSEIPRKHLIEVLAKPPS